jgi:glycyl-tRNA synthetase
MAEFDDSGAIGRRYRRQDEIGTPFALTVDYETPGSGTVTLRDRDSMQQVRVRTDTLTELIRSLLDGSSSFASLKSA